MTTTSARTQNYVVAPEEITMLPLLTPPAGDTRTAEEYTYDLITSGQYYTVAAELDAPAPVTTPERRREIFREFDQVFGLSDAADEPPTLEIERCKFNEEGEPYNEPWVSFTYGEASIDIGDKGNGNLCAYGQMINFHDFGPLRDLAALLSHPTVAAALALQAPMPAEDPRIEIAREADSLLAELKDWVDEHTLACPPVVASPVTIEEWQSDEGGTTYTDFEAGDGLTRVRLGTYGGEKPGVHVVISKKGINEYTDEVITLADVRQLRNNLTTLLSDPRVLAAFSEPPPTGTILDPALCREIRAAMEQANQRDPEPIQLPIPIGTIAGCTVNATYYDNGALFEAELIWSGLKITADTEEAKTVVFELDDDPGGNFVGEMTFAMWGKLKELAQTDIVERLIALTHANARMPKLAA